MHAEHPEARMDLMLWASERGQMLSRTVKGMMMYGSALRQLELLEAPAASLLQHTSAADGKFSGFVASFGDLVIIWRLYSSGPLGFPPEIWHEIDTSLAIVAVTARMMTAAHHWRL